MKILKYLGLLILVLVIFFFAKGLLTPSVEYQSEVTVDKSAAESWAVMSDQENLPKWIKGFVRSELVSGNENSVGAVSNVYINENGQEMVMQETVTAVSPPNQLGMTFTMDFMDMDYEMLLNEKDGKTKITTKSKAIGNGMFAKSMISFMPSAMKAQEDENLNSLKKLIDENVKNYFPEEVLVEEE